LALGLVMRLTLSSVFMPTPKFQSGNQAAAKPPDLLQTARVVLQLTPIEKAALVKAAYPQKISDFLRNAIDGKLGKLPRK
jgi:hypothetical protein